MDRLKSLSEAIRTLIDEQFSGCIKINFSQGGIGRVEKLEEFIDTTVILTGDTKKNEKTRVKKRNSCGSAR
jgi:hypothetical protein